MPLTLAHPWFLLLLLLLPVAAWWRGQQGKPAAFLYSSVQLVSGVANISHSSAGRALAALRWLTLALFIVGLARPQFVESETAVKASGIDIVVAIDLSGSMESEDFELKGQRVNRITIAKDVLKKFVEKRPGDRIGLVAFAGKAYVAAPLTLDFMVPNGPENRAVAEVVQSMAAEAGFDLKIRVTEFATSLKQSDDGDYQLYLNGWSGRSDPDGNSFVFQTCNAPQNNGKFCDKEVDAAHAVARATSDPAERKKAYEIVARKFLAEGSILYLYPAQVLVALTDKVEGYKQMPDGLVRVVGVKLK